MVGLLAWFVRLIAARVVLLTKLLPIALVATAALWLVVILITDFPAWTLAVYVALAIPAIQRFSP